MTTEKQTIGEWLETLASKAPVPGGGGASALAGALGAALGRMVGNLTVGKKRYAQVEDEVREILGALAKLQAELTELADEDARAFAPLAAAYSLPSQTEEEKAKKDAVMEENLLAASLVPLRIMEKALETLKFLEVLEEKGSRMAVSDVGVAAQMGRAAVNGAVMNVYINTKSMKNREQAQQLNARAQETVKESDALADQIYNRVLAKLQ